MPNNQLVGKQTLQVPCDVDFTHKFSEFHKGKPGSRDITPCGNEGIHTQDYGTEQGSIWEYYTQKDHNQGQVGGSTKGIVCSTDHNINEAGRQIEGEVE